MSSRIIINTDGGARGNPGPAGAGIVIAEDGVVIAEIGKFLGAHQTNNWAEYEALFIALTALKERGLNAAQIEARLDSMLVVEQVQGHWKIKEPSLKPQWEKVRALIAESFPHIAFRHVPRAENKGADALVNKAIDSAGY